MSWGDSFGVPYGWRVDSMDGARLVVKYANAAKEDLDLGKAELGRLQVPKEKIWKEAVQSKAVPLRKKSHSDE